MKIVSKIKSVLIVFTILTLQQTYSQCDGNQTELDEIKLKYERRFKDIEKDGERIEDEAPDPDNGLEATIQIDFDIEMKEQHFALDVISVTMKDKKIALDLPQITMETKSIKFNTIYTKMVLKKTGQYPQIHCEDTWIRLPFGGKTKGVPKCTTKWKDILTKIPEIHSKVIEIKTDIPNFKMGRTEFITAIPEFRMIRQDIIMDLPSIIIKNVSTETKEMQKKAAKLQDHSQDLVAAQKKEFSSAISGNFQCQREGLLSQRNSIIASFSTSMEEIDQNIKQLQANGVNLSEIKTTDGTSVNLLEIKREIQEREKMAINDIDSAIDQLNKTEHEMIQKYFSA